MHGLFKQAHVIIPLPGNLAQAVRECLPSTNIAVSPKGCPANTGNLTAPKFLTVMLHVHAHTSGHACYKQIHTSFFQQKRERRGKVITLYFTRWKVCSHSEPTWYMEVKYIYIKSFLKSPPPEDMSNACWGHSKEIRWHQRAPIKQKYPQFTNRSLKHRKVKGPVHGHAESGSWRGLNINLPSSPWRLKRDLRALSWEPTLPCLLLAFVLLFPFFFFF